MVEVPCAEMEAHPWVASRREVDPHERQNFHGTDNNSVREALEISSEAAAARFWGQHLDIAGR